MRTAAEGGAQQLKADSTYLRLAVHPAVPVALAIALLPPASFTTTSTHRIAPPGLPTTRSKLRGRLGCGQPPLKAKLTLHRVTCC